MADPFGKMFEVLISKKTLVKMGICMVAILRNETKDYYAKRGWPGKDPKSSDPPIWDSFSYSIVGNALEIVSSFEGMEDLVLGEAPVAHPGKDASPHPGDKAAHHPGDKIMHPGDKGSWWRHPGDKTRAGRTHRGVQRFIGGGHRRRKSFIVPLKDRTGKVVFKMAPLKTENSWIHPGIAQFSFLELAFLKGQNACTHIFRDEIAKVAKRYSGSTLT